MAFQFSLDSLLRLWRGRERLERLRLVALAARILRLRHEIEQADRAASEDRANLVRLLGDGLAGSQLHFALMCDDGRRRFREFLQNQLAALEMQHQRQQRVFQEARKQREIFENLRARQLETYRAERRRREQQQVDELFLLRLGRESAE
jgi:flagellar export protein FliJ